MRKKIFKIVCGLFVSSSFLYSSGIDSLGFYVGNANTPSTQIDTPNYTVVIDKPDDNYKTMELYSVFDKLPFIKMNPYLSYSYSYNDGFRHQYVLAGLNKYFKVFSSKIYFGVLGGYGQMKWEYDPMTSSEADNSTQSYVAGVQAGLAIPFSSSWFLDLNTKYLSHEYITDLQTSVTTSEIEHYETMIAQIGLSYRF